MVEPVPVLGTFIPPNVPDDVPGMGARAESGVPGLGAMAESGLFSDCSAALGSKVGDPGLPGKAPKVWPVQARISMRREWGYRRRGRKHRIAKAR